MFAIDLGARTGEEAVRVVRALCRHRYVRGSLHAVHALAFDALASAGSVPAEATAACAWARGVLADRSIEHDSRDPRLVRGATADELAAVLAAFWVPGADADRAHDALLGRAIELGLDVPRSPPFDEEAEDDMHPVLVDAGWELVPLAALDPVRHKGVIDAFDEPILFEAARFEEESAIPPRVLLQELPALGLAELLRGVDAAGELTEPLVLWADGDAVYHDYVVRGVRKAAKIEG